MIHVGRVWSDYYPITAVPKCLFLLYHTNLLHITILNKLMINTSHILNIYSYTERQGSSARQVIAATNGRLSPAFFFLLLEKEQIPVNE